MLNKELTKSNENDESFSLKVDGLIIYLKRGMRMKKALVALLILPAPLLLCSFAIVPYPESDLDLMGYVPANVFLHENYPELRIGETVDYDLGRRNEGIIGQYLSFTLLDYEKCDASQKRGYVYDYDKTFVDPAGFLSFTKTFSFQYTSQYSYYYSHTISWGISNALNASLSDGALALQSGMEVNQSESYTEGYSYSFGTVSETSSVLPVNLSKIPAGYSFTVCFVCSAQFFRYNYTVYNNYWLGPVASTDLSESVMGGREILFDPASMFITVGIKKTGTSGGPTYYLHS